LGGLNFSQRVGVTPTNPLPMLDNISSDLRISLYNTIQKNLFPPDLHTNRLTGPAKKFAEAADEYFFSKPVFGLEHYYIEYLNRMLNWFQSAAWNVVCEFVDWCLEYDANPINKHKLSRITFLVHQLNSALLRHNSGYRVVGTELIPISDEQELAEVKASIAQNGQFSTVGTHIIAAARHLNPAATPNYRNSVKESISAVEAAAKIVAGKDAGTLGPALSWLEKKAGLHPALKSGFSSLYGWTSEADGIRHALMNDDKLTFDEAKFMLVACSAFSNYLISVYAKDPSP
jgi:AbiJ N-terminal domain 4